MKKSKFLRTLFISTLIVSCFLSVLPFMRIEEAKAEIQYVNIVPIGDARVYEGTPDTNYGSSDYMTVGRQQTNHLEIWIRFNLTDTASTYSDLRLKSAVLRLRRGSTYGTIANVQVQVWATETGWNESAITWSNKPSLLTNYTSCAFAGDKFSEAGWRRVALNKSDVEYWMGTSDKLYSVCLTAQNQLDTDAYFQVYSKESDYDLYLDLYFAPEGTESGSQVAVLVDTTIQDLNPSYFELFARGVEKWLEWWKIDYEEIDLRATPITRSLLSSYNLILVGQFNLTMIGNLDSSELQAINASVFEDGVGLVQLDPYLAGYTDIWSDYNELFDVQIQGWVSSSDKMNLTVVDNTHFITDIYRSGTQMNALFGQEVDSQESNLVFENVTVGGSGNTLVVMPYNDSNSPALVINSHGNGRTVLSTFSTGRVDLGIFAGMDGFGERPLRTNSGMHGLLWRSMVWAAKKPFAFMGMPPFLTSTMYGVGEGASLDYIDKLVEHCFFVHLNIFADDVYRRGSAYWSRLRDYYWNGTVHVAPQSWNNNWLIYWNLTGNREYDSSTLSQYFDWLDGNQTAWNITFSAWRIPNFCAVGENAVPYLLDREWDLIGCIYNIPYSEGTLSGVWMWDTPQRRCAVVMDFEDENSTMFNVMLFLPVNNATYFVPSALQGAVNPPNVAKATEQMLAQLEHGLADLLWGEAFTFAENAGAFGASNWDTLLTWVTGNITSQYPFYITASSEYIARYVLNRRHLSISNYTYSGNTLTLDFSGTTSLPMAFYLFTDQKILGYSGTLDYFRSYGDDGYLVWIPAYSGNHQVSITLGNQETNKPRIHYTTANVTSTSSSSSKLVINAQQMWKHTKPKYFFEIDCTDLGQPQNVTVDDNPISYYYDDATKIAKFNVTFQASREIHVSWYATIDTTPPNIMVISPENKTYYTDTVALTYIVDEPTAWEGYSLDGAENITATGNTILSGLGTGSHVLRVYANDTVGNTGVSDTIYFTIGQIANPWQMTFDHRDLDYNNVDNIVTWKLYNGSQPLAYTEGEYSLPDGNYTLKTYYHGKLINQTDLDTSTYGNSTITISLQMKPHSSVFGGYIAFNNTISSLTIISQTNENLTFAVEGLSPISIVTDVPRNCTYIQRNGINQTGWIYTEDSPNYIYIESAELSSWEYYFPVVHSVATFGKTTVGSFLNNAPPNFKFGCTFTEPSGGGTITMISIYMREFGGGQTVNVRAAIYTNYSGSAPVDLGVYSDPVAVGEWAWYNFTVTWEFDGGNPIWLGVIVEGSVELYREVGEPNQLPFGPDAYSDGFSDPFGTPLYQAWELDIYATYVPFGTPPDTTPPTILILSPENKTYALEDVPLTFTVSESTSWIGYSLDGQANITITGNTILTSLLDGPHYVVLYVNDTNGNMGASETVYFTVDTTPPNIMVISPENKTYYTDTVALTYIVDEPTAWEGYSLDGAENITATGNTILSGLGTGSHTLTVYANDTSGNWGVQAVFFEIVVVIDREVFSITSNSTISALNFSSQDKILEFTVSGPSGTIGYIEVLMAKILTENATDLEIYFDGEKINYTLTSTDEVWVVYLEYAHSAHHVRIVFSNVQTVETPSTVQTIAIPLVKVLLAILLLIGFVIGEKRRCAKNRSRKYAPLPQYQYFSTSCMEI